MYLISEKKNNFAIHGVFDSLESAKKHLKDNIPEYIKRGYFIDKTLTESDFEIISRETLKED